MAKRCEEARPDPQSQGIDKNDEGKIAEKAEDFLSSMGSPILAEEEQARERARRRFPGEARACELPPGQARA